MGKTNPYTLELLEPRILLSAEGAMADMQVGLSEVPEVIEQSIFLATTSSKNSL